MKPIPPNQQRSLVERLTKMCGGGYSPEVRRKYFISGPQWAAAYQGQALFYAPTREPVTFEDVIREFGKIGIGYWSAHDSDVIPTSALGTSQQADIVANIRRTLETHGVKCSMVTTETFYNEVFAAGPAAEAPEVREYAAFRVKNTVDIGHQLGAGYAVYWPGSLGYLTQGSIDEVQMLGWYADALNAACDRDIEVAIACRIQRVGVPAQHLNFVYGTLSQITQRARPVDGISRAQLMSDVHSILDPERGVFANFGRFRRRPCGEHFVVERFRSDHGTLHAM